MPYRISSEFKLIINLMEGTGNDLCQNLVFASPHRNSNSKDVTQCVMENVGGLTTVKSFLVSLSDAASLAHRGGFIHEVSVLASCSEGIQKNLWSPATALRDARTKAGSADTELLYRQNRFSRLDLCITKHSRTAICPKRN